jgi:hypothetical protein
LSMHACVYDEKRKEDMHLSRALQIDLFKTK